MKININDLMDENIIESLKLISLILNEFKLILSNPTIIIQNNEQNNLEINKEHPLYNTIGNELRRIEHELYKMDSITGSWILIGNKESYPDLEFPCSQKEIISTFKEIQKYYLDLFKKSKNLKELSIELGFNN